MLGKRAFRIAFLSLALPLFGSALIAACGSDEETATAGGSCTPGQSVACAGPAGCSGFQACNASGTGFNTCDCGGGSGGGSTTSSGTATTTSTTGSGGATGSGGGGTGGNVGSGGNSGSGGGNSADCPTAEPNNGGNCNTPVTGCTYAGDVHCECWNGDWDCVDCPAAEPNDGDACDNNNNAGDRCSYGATSCWCSFASDNWSCNTCPSAEPNDNDNCTEVGLHCVYGGTECSCFGGGGQPDWNCN
jgi:hypothetical protein